jgi:hypothetical protein
VTGSISWPIRPADASNRQRPAVASTCPTTQPFTLRIGRFRHTASCCFQFLPALWLYRTDLSAPPTRRCQPGHGQMKRRRARRDPWLRCSMSGGARRERMALGCGGRPGSACSSTDSSAAPRQAAPRGRAPSSRSLPSSDSRYRHGRSSNLGSGPITDIPVYRSFGCDGAYTCRQYGVVKVDLASRGGDSGSGFYRLYTSVVRRTALPTASCRVGPMGRRQRITRVGTRIGAVQGRVRLLTHKMAR